jgi:signal transduction histidine kinase
VDGPEPDAPAAVDPERLQLVLVNLLSNAIRHTPAGGQVTARGRRHGAGWRLEVVDTGAGIAREHQERIFEKYYRVPGQAGRGGVGLGLFLAREIARAHGGELGVESAPGEGSRFWCDLPDPAPPA